MKKNSNKMKSALPAIAVIAGAFFCARATSQNARLKPGQSNGDSTQASSPVSAVYRSQIEPIFLKERPGHARCYECHTLSNRVFHLDTLSPGSTEWTLDQSKRNYESAIRLVESGRPVSSKLLLHPLAPEAGGDAFHSGGRQFASQNDPDWMTLADWVRSAGRSASAASLPATRIYVTNGAGDTIDVIDPTADLTGQICTRWNEKESTCRKNGSCPCRGMRQSKS